MATNFKGFQQVSLSTWKITTDVEKEGFIWFVRDIDTASVTYNQADIYVSTKHYAHLDEDADAKLESLITSFGSIVDVNGEWVGFDPALHYVTGATTSLEDAIKKMDSTLFTKITLLDSAITGFTADLASETQERQKADAILQTNIDDLKADVIHGLTPIDESLHVKNVRNPDTLKTYTEISVNVSKDTGNTLSLKDDGLFVNVPVIHVAEYNLVKNTATPEGLASQYWLTKDDVQVGPTIDITKDQFLKDAKFISSATQDDVDIDPTVVIGDPYLKFIFETADADVITYIAVKSLVDVYTAGNGLMLSVHAGGKEFSVNVDTATEAFLSVGVDGIKLSGIQTAIDNKATITLASSKTYTDEEVVKHNLATDTHHDIRTEVATKATKIYVDEELEKKQNVIKAGANIEIDSTDKVTVSVVGLADVALSGSYNDIKDKPFIPTKTSEIINDSDFTTKKYVDDELVKKANVTTVSELDDKVTVLETNLTTEIVDRTEADGLLSTAITTETARAKAVEGELTGLTTSVKTNIVNAINDLKTSVDGKLQSISAANESIMVSSGVTPSVKVQISNEVGNSLSLKTEAGKEGLFVEVPEVIHPEYALVKNTTTSDALASQYWLTKDGVQVGPTIDVPKDQFLSDAKFIPTATQDDADIDASVIIGDPYIKFLFQLTTKTPMYIAVKGLIDVYTAGSGLVLNGGKFSVTIDPTTESYLTVGPNGIKLMGVKTAFDKAVLDEKIRATDAETLLTTNLEAEVARAKAAEGDLTILNTIDKASLVGAINELQTTNTTSEDRLVILETEVLNNTAAIDKNKTDILELMSSLQIFGNDL